MSSDEDAGRIVAVGYDGRGMSSLKRKPGGRERPAIVFAGCDYLGLRRHRDIVNALCRCAVGLGISASASRSAVGEFPVHRELERRVARFFRCEGALILPAGWMAPAAAVTALAGSADGFVRAANAHGATVEAFRSAGAPIRIAESLEVSDVARASRGLRRPAVFVDGVDLVRARKSPVAPVFEYIQKHGGVFVIDDSHGIGALGAGGRGVAARCLQRNPSVVLCGSLAKAFGVHGGFVAGSTEFCNAVRNHYDGFAGSTPLPPPLAAAAVAALDVMERDGAGLRRRMRANANFLRLNLQKRGLPANEPGIPWVVLTGPDEYLQKGSAVLLECGIRAPFFKYPGAGGSGGWIRISVSALHTKSQMLQLMAAIDTWLKN